MIHEHFVPSFLNSSEPSLATSCLLTYSRDINSAHANHSFYFLTSILLILPRFFLLLPSALTSILLIDYLRLLPRFFLLLTMASYHLHIPIPTIVMTSLHSSTVAGALADPSLTISSTPAVVDDIAVAPHITSNILNPITSSDSSELSTNSTLHDGICWTLRKVRGFSPLNREILATPSSENLVLESVQNTQFQNISLKHGSASSVKFTILIQGTDSS